MSHIILKDNINIKAPNGVLINGNEITILKNQVINDTITIKVLDRKYNELIINAKESSQVKFILDIEDHNDDAFDYNLVFNADENTNINFLFIADIQTKNTNINFNGYAKADSNLQFTACFVSNVINANINLDLIGKGANLDVKTITVSAKDNYQALKISMIHHAPFTNADMTNIGIASSNGVVKLHGVGEILQGMKNSNAFQTLKGIITSDLAHIDVNPILIIDEYDIKAGHAATVGRIEEETLYYLMSRGLTEFDAQRLVINGMLQPFLDEIDDDLIKENVINLVNGRI